MELDSDFERKAKAAFAEEIHRKVVDDPNNLAFQFMQEWIDNLRRFGQRHDLDVEPVIEHIHVESVDRSDDGVHVRLVNDHEAGAIFEVGAIAHPIEGDPLHWVDPDTGEDVFATEVDHPGVPESRALRDAIHWLRREAQS